MDRRKFLFGAAQIAGAALAARPASANVPTPYDWNASPPRQSREAFVEWMVKGTAARTRDFSLQRFDRFQQLLAHRDVWDEADMRAFLLTPREEFVTAGEPRPRLRVASSPTSASASPSPARIRSPRMTNTSRDRARRQGPRDRHRVRLPVGLSFEPHSQRLVDRDHPPALTQRTRALYDALIARGYSEYRAIRTRNADGYYGWADAQPFDKIIVTCGIDHIPPPLLAADQFPNGIMVIPVGPPGAQHVLKAVKQQSPDGRMSVVRSDIYGGAIIPFVPFTGSHHYSERPGAGRDGPAHFAFSITFQPRAAERYSSRAASPCR